MKHFTYVLALMAFSFIACKDDCERPTACSLEPEASLCQLAFVKYLYNQQTKQCEQFIWNGCGDYPFDTLEECEVCLCND